MARYRRRNKQSPWKTATLWTAVLVLAGWGLYQAAEFRQRLIDDYALSRNHGASGELLTAHPAVAVEGVSVARRGTGQSGSPRAGTLEPSIEIIGALPPREDPSTPSLRATQLLNSLPPPPTFDASLGPVELVAQSQAALDAGRIVEARWAINAALARCSDPATSQLLRDRLAALNAAVFFGPDVLPDDPFACYIEIEPGDSFLKLGRDFSVPPAFLERINPSLNPRGLRPLAGVKVVRGPFKALICKQAARMDLFVGELYVRSFPVALPQANYLPAGEYLISGGNKLQVGARAWIGFEGVDENTRSVENGWIYGSWGPRGTGSKNRDTGIALADADLLELYNVLMENRSPLHVEP